MNRTPCRLLGESLVWVTFDPARTVSAALRWMLQAEYVDRDVRLDIQEASSVEEAGRLSEQLKAGLFTLVLAEEDLAGACKALRRVQARQRSCVRCVYVTQRELVSDARLLEAGAQIVIDQIPWMQRIVPRLAEQAPRRSGGNHPITMGLVDRLPWRN
ncbi:MAG: hypothetical protein ACKVY0_10145 [Prosthecobacter sp.]|uniref:hypothetical protein n=1 Tax=Prosthecobacter sp. TaxID=1965333 RepID=UPI0038FE2454